METKVACTCKEWDAYAHQIFHAQIIAFVNGMAAYSGIIWKYCPWCGKELHETKEKDL